jgi:hypothetical protein
MIHSLLLQQGSDNTGSIFGGLCGGIFGIAFAILVIAAYWKIFVKASQPGWAAIIPIYNLLVLLRVVGRPWWWLILMLVPFLNIVIGIIVLYDLARSFGHGAGFTLGLIFLNVIFFLILGFGADQYVGPAGRSA